MFPLTQNIKGKIKFSKAAFSGSHWVYGLLFMTCLGQNRKEIPTAVETGIMVSMFLKDKNEPKFLIK